MMMMGLALLLVAGTHSVPVTAPLAPGAFYRSDTAVGGSVYSIKEAVSAWFTRTWDGGRGKD